MGSGHTLAWQTAQSAALLRQNMLVARVRDPLLGVRPTTASFCLLPHAGDAEAVARTGGARWPGVVP